MAFGVRQHPGLKASHGIQQGHRRDFAARQHKIPQADLFVHLVVNKSLVNTFIATAHQNRAIASRPTLNRSMVQGLTDR